MTAGRFEMLIRQRLAALARMLPSARAGDVTSVHQARVATRRLREALPLLVRGSSLRKHRRTVRRLTRSLGPVRELDVALLTLDEFAGTGEVPRAGVLSLHQTIRQERARMHADMRRSIDRTRHGKLSAKLVAAAKKRDQEGGRPSVVDPKQLVEARARAARRAERLRISIENAAAIYLPDRLHEVRIATKKLRYAMEIVRDLSRSRATAQIADPEARAGSAWPHPRSRSAHCPHARAQGSPNAPTLRVSADMDLLVRRLEIRMPPAPWPLHRDARAPAGDLRLASDLRPRLDADARRSLTHGNSD